MTETAIEFRSVVKRYGAAPAVAGIDLAIAKGELVTFLGPSAPRAAARLRRCA